MRTILALLASLLLALPCLPALGGGSGHGQPSRRLVFHGKFGG